MTARPLRSAALNALSTAYRWSGRMPQGLDRPRVQVLMVHDIGESGEAEFTRLIETLAQRHRFISYSDAVDRILTGRIDAPYLSVTFDDGLISTRIAARVLSRFGISACFFLVPPFVGETDARKIEEYCRKGLNISPTGFINWDDVEELLRNGHEIGGHSMTHTVFSSLSESALRDEVGGSYRDLKRRFGAVRHFAWPFGHFSHFSAQAARIVFETGYESCASAQRGCHVTGVEGPPRDLCVRRDLVVVGESTAHLLYFLARNGLRADAAANHWPAEWKVIQ